MDRNLIGKTDIKASIIGLGTVKLGRNKGVKYPKAFTIPNDKEALHILNVASDCGINLIDTAPAYGNSEERLGQLLKKTHNEWIISTKVGEVFNHATGKSRYCFTPEFIEQSIKNSLKHLQREQIDIVLIHSNGDDEKIIKEYGALEILNHFKHQGIIRATGMSSKTIEGGLLTLKHADIAMVTHNLEYQKQSDVIAYAHQHNKGIFIKKALASGHAAHINNQGDPITKSFECIFQQPGVNSIILGSITPKHIRDNAAKAIKVFNRALSQ